MSAIALTIPARARDIGGFAVGRVLPFAKRRMVGPFLFLDHMGPKDFAPGEGVDVGPHPHIGLATVTYLLDGVLMHRDSLGVEQRIAAGDVNWMTAGRGIAHSERTPAPERGAGHRLHGLQSWVALPAAEEDCAPAFVHHPADTLPRIAQAGARAVLIAGRAFGETSPVAFPAPILYAHVTLAPGSALPLPEAEERAAYVVEGAAAVDGERVEARHLAVLTEGAHTLTAPADGPGATVMVLGGAAFPEGRHIWWNLVSTDRGKIEAAKDAWRAGTFPQVPGETDALPLPEA